ncbi:MAG: TIM barrel protein [Planctomycetia bacterium]|nr:TIM barrel protein [Planctomycetia bacterium]
MNRRAFLQSSLGIAAFGLSGNILRNIAVAAETKKIPIALQVYSVYNFAEKDLADTLQKIAQMGYQGVEFAGYYGHEAKDIRKMLDDNGLVAVSTHLGLDSLLGDTFQKTVEYNKILGNKNLVVAGGIDRACCSDTGNQMTAFLFNELSLKAEEFGMQIGFHAHGGDFVDVNGQTAWDLFFSRTRPEVIAQMDIGNCLAGGADPYASIEKFPNRGQLIHLKAHGPHGTVLGGQTDVVDWDRVFKLCETVAGTEWYIVEQESASEGLTSLDACNECMKNLRKMGKI